MKRISFLLSLIVCLSSINTYVEASILLDIPPRHQWENNQGYCGSCSVQQVALYYGTYVSQYVCRAIINPNQSEQVLVGVNMSTLLDALSLKYESWNYEIHSPPQYRDYLVWGTQHLNNRVPVIITAYIRGMSDPDYDHIMVATGFNAVDPNSYDSNNQIIYNDCFSSSSITRSFGSLYDDRSMQGNGAIYEYCIPKQYDYGCAVTGIKDIEGVTLPVYLSIDSWDEPNVTIGEAPIQLNATIRVSLLTVGRSYLLLRYDDYRKVPSRDFHNSSFNSARSFVATDTTHYFDDQFMSNAVVVYRCILDQSGVCVQANDSDGPVIISSFDPVSITVGLNPGDYAGLNADWWIAVHIPFAPPGDWYTYVYPTGWWPGINLCVQTPLFALSPFEVLNMTLPVGNYTFYFAIDDPDGAATGPWWGIDSVEVTVQ